MTDAAETVDWFSVKNDDRKFSGLPKWQRTFAVTSAGEVFAAAIIAAPEMVVFMAASYDGTPCCVQGEHAYYPTSWLALEFPACKAACAAIEQMAKDILARKASEGMREGQLIHLDRASP